MKPLKLIQKPVLFLTLLFAISNFGLAQNNVIDNIVGKNYTIDSSFLNEEREIQVFLPESYHTSSKEYPVIYILDGQRFFLHTVSLHQSFVEFKLTPEFIVIGIKNIQSKRNNTFSSGAKQFSNYLEHEIIQFVDKNFRTTKNRLLFGWAYGGGFVLQELISKPDFFTSYIAASPYPVFPKMEALDSLIKQKTTSEKLLYYSSDINEGVVKEGTDSLNLLFNNVKPNVLKWAYQGLQGEEHRSTPYTTLYHGIKKHFEFYPEIEFKNLEDFKKKGGMSFLKQYYEKRAKDYGLSTNPSNFVKYDLTRKAMQAKDYEEFDKFVTTFQKENYLEEIRIYRACYIAEFYLDNEKYDKAIEVYKILMTKHPNEPMPLEGIAEVYTLLKEDKIANNFIKKAAVLKKANTN